MNNIGNCQLETNKSERDTKPGGIGEKLVSWWDSCLNNCIGNSTPVIDIKNLIFLQTFLGPSITAIAKYEEAENGETHIVEQLKQNLALHLVTIFIYGGGSQIERGRK